MRRLGHVRHVSPAHAGPPRPHSVPQKTHPKQSLAHFTIAPLSISSPPTPQSISRSISAYPVQHRQPLRRIRRRVGCLPPQGSGRCGRARCLHRVAAAAGGHVQQLQLCFSPVARRRWSKPAPHRAQLRAVSPLGATGPPPLPPFSHCSKGKRWVLAPALPAPWTRTPKSKAG